MNILFLCIAGFFASMVDAIAGGGGLISVPAYLAFFNTPYFALGTNKFSSTLGVSVSSFNYFKSGKVHMGFLKYLIPFTFIGAILGVNTVLSINTKYLNFIVLILLILVAIYSLFSKTSGDENKFEGINKKNLTLGIILAFSLGFYDGFFGPGTGSFLIFGLSSILKFDFITSSGNAKVLNFVSNISSLIMFALKGKIIYSVGIPVGLTMIIGSYIGSKLAIKNGAKLIKPIFIITSLAMAIKMLLSFMGII